MADTFGRRFPIFSLNQSLSDLSSLSEMSYRGGGGYGKRGRGPNRGGGRGRGGGGLGARGGSRGRGRSSGAEGHGAPPPPELRGRALGMWYASRSRAHKKARERNEVSIRIIVIFCINFGKLLR